LKALFPILYYFGTPFNPVASFRMFLKSPTQVWHPLAVLLFGILFSCFLYARQISQIEDLRGLLIAFFGLGMLFRILLLTTLLFILWKRLGLGKLSWYTSLTCVSFALFPAAISWMWGVYMIEYVDVVHWICHAWSALIVSVGISVLLEIAFRKAVIYVFAGYFLAFLTAFALFGIHL
jgi:hypothetical protein